MAHVVCPHCKGGRTEEKSCVIYNRDGVQFYRCYRNSCDRPYGVYNGSDDVALTRPTMAMPNLKPLPPGRMRWLCSKFFLKNEDVSRLRPLWTGDRFWFPIRDQRGIEDGGCARSYTNTPKTLTYGDGWKTGAWYSGPDANEIWLVEDQISAAKVARVKPSVALLGTSLHQPASRVLASLRKLIVVALDADALGTSVRVSEKLQRLGCETRVVFTPKDFKNMDDGEFGRYING